MLVKSHVCCVYICKRLNNNNNNNNNICLFDNFKKLSTCLGFSRDILEEWARVCCVHVFLVT